MPKNVVVHSTTVGIATRYGLDGPGIESLWGRDLPHPCRPALGPTWPTPQLVRGVKRPGLGVDRPPHLAPRLKKECSHTFLPPLVLNGLFWGEWVMSK
jgi:hypothetical protein